MPPQKRNNSRTVAAVIVAVIAVLLCIVMVLIFIIVKGAVREASSGISNSKNYGGAVPEETIPFGYDSGDDSQLLISAAMEPMNRKQRKGIMFPARRMTTM